MLSCLSNKEEVIRFSPYWLELIGLIRKAVMVCFIGAGTIIRFFYILGGARTLARKIKLTKKFVIKN